MSGRPITAPCGTRSAYKRHLRNMETPCQPCRQANNQWHTNHRTNKKEGF